MDSCQALSRASSTAGSRAGLVNVRNPAPVRASRRVLSTNSKPCTPATAGFRTLSGRESWVAGVDMGEFVRVEVAVSGEMWLIHRPPYTVRAPHTPGIACGIVGQLDAGFVWGVGRCHRRHRAHSALSKRVHPAMALGLVPAARTSPRSAPSSHANAEMTRLSGANRVKYTAFGTAERPDRQWRT